MGGNYVNQSNVLAVSNVPCLLSENILRFHYLDQLLSRSISVEI
jgi:hypothetical protein